MRRISPAAARRAALAAQGLGGPRRPGPATRRQLRAVLDRIRLLQLDSVNVVVRAHYVPLFSRLGGYPRALLDEAAWAHSARRPRLLVEYWAHEASLLPVQDWPLLLSGAKRRGWWRNYAALAEREPGLVADVLAAVKELGPIGAGDLEAAVGGGPQPSAKRSAEGEDRRASQRAHRAQRASSGTGPDSTIRSGSWWNRSDIKRICEWLFGTGQLTTGRRVNFNRLYDLPERVFPPEVLAAPAPPPEAAAAELITRAAAALGVATEPDLRDYYRLAPAPSRQAVADLVAAGVLEPVEVTGWSQPAYRHIEAGLPRQVHARALLCPFDPMIWDRGRTERLFGFRYRIEIYVPSQRRVHGYYVFPFLLGDELVARVDLKADRAAGVLRVPGAFAEPGADPRRVSAELAVELGEMAGWLGLDGVVVGERGDLAGQLALALR